MIDQGVFKNEWVVLAERFGRFKNSRLIAQRYYEYLNERMDTDTFVAAARQLFASSEYFPKPDAFLEAAGLTRDTLAQVEWELCQRVMSGDRHALGQMSEEGQRVIRVLGGVDRLRMTPLDQIDWRRKEFLKLYGSTEREALPAWTDKGRKLLADAMRGKLKP
jgi:hypothetical protein